MATEAQRHQITAALQAAESGAEAALEQVLPLVYEELRQLARRQLRGEPVGHTLSATALVHEAYFKLVDQTRTKWTGRAHFFAVAAQAMRRILVDYARRHRATRRGGPDRSVMPLGVAGELPIGNGDVGMPGTQRAEDLIALDDALERLATLNPRLARIVECRFFGGLSEKETAEALGISQRTAARDWLTARGWLYRQLREG